MVASPDPAWLAPESRFIRAGDGRRLHFRLWGNAAAKGLPLLCLPGLTRNVDDFDAVALDTAARGERRVVAMDYRGRGLSDHDPDWKRYDLMVELDDLQQGLVALGIDRAIFLGTSRGGLITALMAISRPSAIAGAILNDIGPVIEPAGIARIRSYVGKIPLPATLDEGAATLRRLFSEQFPTQDEASWRRFAARTWEAGPDGMRLRYDPNLMRPLAAMAEAPIPPFWEPVLALKAAPMLVIRGALSVLLSPETAREMIARHGDAEGFEVPDQGHAPLLEEPETLAVIARFVAGCEARKRGGGTGR